MLYSDDECFWKKSGASDEYEGATYANPVLDIGTKATLISTNEEWER